MLENDDSEEKKWLIYAFIDHKSGNGKATEIVATLVKPNRAGSSDKDWYSTLEDTFQEKFSHILDYYASITIDVLLDERDNKRL